MSGGKTELLHVLVKRHRARGLSFAAAMGEAINEVERMSYGGSYDWREHFEPTTQDKRILRTEVTR